MSSVLRDEAGGRYVEADIDVAGDADTVWAAIATGHGVSQWFVPTTIDERVGGTVRCAFGPDMESLATITAWDPPRSFRAVSQDLGPEAPPLTTVWRVEARESSQPSCRVVVRHSVPADGESWEPQLEQVKAGWPRFFRKLREYLDPRKLTDIPSPS